MVGVVVVTATASFLLQPIVMTFLRRSQVLDLPTDRSSHQTPTPRGGGLGVIGAIGLGLLGSIVLRDWILSTAGWIACGSVLGFALVGWLDDLYSLAVHIRLVSQVLLGTLAVLAVMSATTKTLPPSMLSWQLVGTGTAALVWIVGYTNAFNFMDGVNGISALNGILAAGVLAHMAAIEQITPAAVLGAATAAACVGFLPWNAPRARLFLGDVGSYALGSALAVIAMWSALSGLPLLSCAAPFVIYVADTGWALVRRIISRRPWKKAHRDHVYQRLADTGMSHVASSLTTVAGSSLMVMASLAPIPIAVLLMTILVVLYLALPTMVQRTRVPRAPQLEVGSR